MEHLSPLLKEMFPDSELARGYSSRKTKTRCILNRALKSHYLSKLVEQIKCRPFSISIDGSNDIGREKMNPMTVHIFDVDRVKHKFLDVHNDS